MGCSEESLTRQLCGFRGQILPITPRHHQRTPAPPQLLSLHRAALGEVHLGGVGHRLPSARPVQEAPLEVLRFHRSHQGARGRATGSAVREAWHHCCALGHLSKKNHSLKDV